MPNFTYTNVTSSSDYTLYNFDSISAVTVPRKETPKPMSVDDKVRAKLREKLDERKVAEKLAMIDAVGDDTYADLTVISFTKQFEKGGTKYAYAAIKIKNVWFTTGSRGQHAYTWEDLLTFLVSGDVPATFTVMVPQES